MSRLVLLLVTLVTALVPHQQAGAVTFFFTGIVDAVVADVNQALDGSIGQGTPFSGFYTFDSTEPDTDSSDPTVGRYEWNNEDGADFFFQLEVGSYAFQSSPTDPFGAVLILDDHTQRDGTVLDLYQANSRFVQVSGPLFPLPGPNPQGSFTMQLENEFDLSTIGSDALPLVPPDLIQFPFNLVRIQNNTAEIVIDGRIGSLTLTGTPAVDADDDGVPDILDNCADDPNPDQADADDDMLGDVCDPFPNDSDNEQAQCEVDRDDALADLAVAEGDLDACLADPRITDKDGDGESDATDLCPRTVVVLAKVGSNAKVDSDGCSVAQFCAAIDVSIRHGSRACRLSDWRNDEPLGADDCRFRDGECQPAL